MLFLVFLVEFCYISTEPSKINTMKNLKFLFILFLFFSCEEENVISSEVDSASETKDVIQPFQGDITIKNGHLNFPSQESFQAYMEELSNDDTPEKRSMRKATQKATGFYSLADKLEVSEQRRKRKNAAGVGDEDDLTQEEAEEEFVAVLLESLIPEENFRRVLDTALSIEVADWLYRITEHGTFSYPNGFEQEFEEVYNSFLENNNQYVQKSDGSYQCSENVKFADTFGVLRGESMLNDILEADQNESEEEVIEEVIEEKRSFGSVDENKKKYGLITFSLPEDKFLKRGSKRYTRNFTHDTRLEVTAYNSYYLVYANTALKVEFKKKKKRYLRIKIRLGFFKIKLKTKVYQYWTKIAPDQLVIGIDNFRGYTKYEDFGLTYAHANTKVSHLNNFSNIASKMIFKASGFDPFIKGLGNKVNIFNHSLTFMGESYNLGQDINGLAAATISDLVYKQLKKYTQQGVLGMSEIKKDHPKLLYHKGVGAANEEHVYLSGLTNYGKRSSVYMQYGKSRSVILGKSNRFYIQEISVFGAAYYRGVWLGVRFVK